jgi:hypothetical protein
MAVLFLSFGLVGLFQAEQLKALWDRVAKGGWHPYRMPTFLVQLLVGGTGIGGAAIFIYIAYIGLRH